MMNRCSLSDYCVIESKSINVSNDDSLPDDYSVMCKKYIVLEYHEDTVFLVEDVTIRPLNCASTYNDSVGNAIFVNLGAYKGYYTDIKFGFYGLRSF